MLREILSWDVSPCNCMMECSKILHLILLSDILIMRCMEIFEPILLKNLVVVIDCAIIVFQFLWSCISHEWKIGCLEKTIIHDYASYIWVSCFSTIIFAKAAPIWGHSMICARSRYIDVMPVWSIYGSIVSIAAIGVWDRTPKTVPHRSLEIDQWSMPRSIEFF